MSDETWERVDNYTEKIGEAISELANQLGVASEYVFELLVRQQIADGIVTLLIFIITITSLILVVAKGFRLAEKIDGGINGNDPFLTIIVLIIVVVLSIAILAQLILSVPDALKQLINPEYYAIKEATKLMSDLFN